MILQNIRELIGKPCIYLFPDGWNGRPWDNIFIPTDVKIEDDELKIKSDLDIVSVKNISQCQTQVFDELAFSVCVNQELIFETNEFKKSYENGLFTLIFNGSSIPFDSTNPVYVIEKFHHFANRACFDR